MKIDLPLGSEALLPDGRRIEPVESPGGLCTECMFYVKQHCALEHAPCIDKYHLSCCPLGRNDSRPIHFREVPEV